MPELPEVETTRRGISPHLLGKQIKTATVFDARLRWPVSPEVSQLSGLTINDIKRRGKYLLFDVGTGHLIWHLGMSGSMRIKPADEPNLYHEHIEVEMLDGVTLTYRDPRRFGACLFTAADPLQHKLIKHLGPEPLEDEFDTDYLYAVCRKRKVPIKNLIMNSQVVVGVGNIYASESLFRAGIRPGRAASRLSRVMCERLVDCIKQVLAEAIEKGGTTLQDFTRSDGKPGYFTQSLQVYGNKGDCFTCGTPIKHITQAQRSSYYCPTCQK